VVPRPELGPVDFKGNRPFLMLVTVIFAVLALLIVRLRRSSYGRRLAAMKDSPAACATLGLNTIQLKLSVFALSAAIAGFGGALYAAQLQSITPERFLFFLSLSLFMLTVVGGIGYVSGALFGGVLLAVSAVAIPDTFTKLGGDYPSFEKYFDWLSDFTTLLPAIIGINLGKNPSGAVSDIVHGFEPLGRFKAAIVAIVVCLVGIWLLAHEDLISNWWFVVLFAVIMVGVPRIAQSIKPEAFMTREQIYARRTAVPLEMMGIDKPFTVADRRMLDGALAIGASEHHAKVTQHPLAFALAGDQTIVDDIAGESEVVS
jgi:branched-chain amino acid transport system permease protein